MNLALMIWQTVRRVATADQVRAAHAELKATRADIADLKATIQTANVGLNAKLDRIIDLLTIPPAVAVEFDVTTFNEDGTIESQTQGARAMKMSDSQRSQLTIRPVDRRKQPAQLDGPPVWATSDPTVATVTPGVLNSDGTVGPDPDPQGLNAVLEGVAVGTCRVTVTGDADLLPNEKVSITGILDVEITAGQAIGINIDASSPVEIPTAPTQAPPAPPQQ